jgi:circadian clock protein KaiC
MDKVLTGIVGFDAVTGGGLPLGRTTLIHGGVGAGKTVMALQWLVNGTRLFEEPGIFVTCEQSPERVLADAATFDCDIGALVPDRLFLLDAQPNPDLLIAGDFDLSGLTAILDAKAKEIGAKRVVFDAIDTILALLSPESARREVYRLHAWLLAHNFTTVITHKAGEIARSLEFMEFMVDCTVTLSHDVVEGISHRSVRVTKYRGSTFEENEVPFVIGRTGLEVEVPPNSDEFGMVATSERVSTGVAQLDELLQGGYYRGASVLISGAPGTAKTALCGAFAEAACRRGEQVLFASFDAGTDEIVRNLSSVGIDLAKFVGAGMLRMIRVHSMSGSPEAHLARIKHLARQQRSRCLVVDPISALAKSGNTSISRTVVERLILWAKSEGITAVCSSLLDRERPLAEGTSLQVSTIADTWIFLGYVVNAGERNRSLSIVKSRGTAHSNQVRELILSSSGLRLSEVYTAGGEVLMGTLRWQKERSERLEREAVAADTLRQRQQFELDLAEIAVRQRELELKRAEQEAFLKRSAMVESEQLSADEQLRRRRMPPDASGLIVDDG